MMYGSVFEYGNNTKPAARFAVGQKVVANCGEAVIKDRRFNDNGWEYGLVFPGITKTGTVWYWEASLK